MCPHHPETAGGGPLLQMSCYARSDTWCTAPAHAQLHEQLRCPPRRAGEAGAGWGRGLWGCRDVAFLDVLDGRVFLFHQGQRPGIAGLEQYYFMP